MRAAAVVILAAHSAIQRAASPRKAVVSKWKHAAASGIAFAILAGVRVVLLRVDAAVLDDELECVVHIAAIAALSMESGKLSPATGAYRSLLLLTIFRRASRLEPRYPVRYSSLVISANRFTPSLYDRFSRLFFSSMYLRLSLKILNLLSFSSTALYDLPCFTSHDSNISFTSSSLRTRPFAGCCSS
nr:hypothetical protein Iba_chr01fCG4530 [Ipomoea batatas]